MWLHNNIHLITVQAYNEKDIVRDDGGLTDIEDDDEVNLKVLPIPSKARFRQDEKGRFIGEIFNFQVSKSELSKKSFTIESGKTHIIRNNNDYRVVSVQDASYMSQIQLYNCIAKRTLPVDDLI